MLAPLCSIVIISGERQMTKDNHLLGTFDLNGIPPARRGIPQIEVTFEIDVNGILKVIAEDKGTGQKNNITIQDSGDRLSKEEIDRMINDAEKYAEEDNIIKEKVNARNELEHAVYSLRNQVDDTDKLGSKLSEDDKETLQTMIKEKSDWLDNNIDADTDTIKEQKREFDETVQPIISKIYQNRDSSHSEL